MTPSVSRRVLWLFLLASLSAIAGLFAACTEVAAPTVTPTPTRTPRPTPTLTPTPTPTPAWPLTVYVPDGLPPVVAETVSTTLTENPDLRSQARYPVALPRLHRYSSQYSEHTTACRTAYSGRENRAS